MEKLILENEIFDTQNNFSIGYNEYTKTYVLNIIIEWICVYNRYYKISKDDYILYKNDKESFYKKFNLEIKRNKDTCYTERILGSNCCFDYDGIAKYSGYQGWEYINGYLYEKRLIDDKIHFIIPKMRIEGIAPLRKNANKYFDKENNFLFYELKK